MILCGGPSWAQSEVEHHPWPQPDDRSTPPRLAVAPKRPPAIAKRPKGAEPGELLL